MFILGYVVIDHLRFTNFRYFTQPTQWETVVLTFFMTDFNQKRKEQKVLIIKMCITLSVYILSVRALVQYLDSYRALKVKSNILCLCRYQWNNDFSDQKLCKHINNHI